MTTVRKVLIWATTSPIGGLADPMRFDADVFLGGEHGSHRLVALTRAEVHRLMDVLVRQTQLKEGIMDLVAEVGLKVKVRIPKESEG